MELVYYENWDGHHASFPPRQTDNCGILSVNLDLKMDTDLASLLQSNPQLLKHGLLSPHQRKFDFNGSNKGHLQF